MKIRHGFVSNSSSSSFVVPFPKDMEMTFENVKRYLFKDQQVIYSPWDINKVTIDFAMCQIMDDIAKQQPNDAELINEAFGGWLEGMPNLDSFRIKGSGHEYDWDAYHASHEAFLKEATDQFTAEHANSNMYVFEFSDNDGNNFAILEHGGTFDNVPHKRISHH
jgi:hypothetical protein